jgi:hypothetical protein
MSKNNDDIRRGMQYMTHAVRTAQGYVDATLRMMPKLPQRTQARLIEEWKSLEDEANELIKFHNELLQKQRALKAKHEDDAHWERTRADEASRDKMWRKQRAAEQKEQAKRNAKEREEVQSELASLSLAGLHRQTMRAKKERQLMAKDHMHTFY